MKRLVIMLLTILLIFSLVACQSNETKELEKSELPKKGELAVRMNIKPLQSYANQLNQRNQGDEAGTSLFKDGDWIYATKYDGIVKFSIDKPQEQTVICNFKAGGSLPTDISVLGDWIYFILYETTSEDSETSYLYRMKKGESRKTKLAGRVDSYLLTEKEIYYEKYNGGAPANAEDTLKSGEFVMSLDGKDERELSLKGHLSGIDNSWIYHVGDDLYRTRPDGSENEKVLDGEVNAVDNCIVENDQVYFIRYDERDEEKSYLIKKAVNGKETVLDTSSDFELRDISPLNKDGDWLYYGKGNKVYKINVNGDGKKILIHQFGKDVTGHIGVVDSILLYNDGILLSAFEMKVFIKREGTKIELGEIQ